MNTKAVFSFVLLLFVITACMSLQDSSDHISTISADSYTLVASLENVSFERACIETNFDRIITESLNKSENHEQTRKVILNTSNDYVNALDPHKTKFFIPFAGINVPFTKDSFSASFIVAELSEESTGSTLLLFENSCGLLTDNCLHAEINSGDAKEFFMLPFGYSALVIK